MTARRLTLQGSALIATVFAFTAAHERNEGIIEVWELTVRGWHCL